MKNGILLIVKEILMELITNQPPPETLSIGGFVHPQQGITTLIKRCTYKPHRGAIVNYPLSFFSGDWEGAWSHTELVFSHLIALDYALIKKLPTPFSPNQRLCFSASEQDGCSRLKIITLQRGRWEHIPIEKVNTYTHADHTYNAWSEPITIKEERSVLKFCELLCGMDYDMMGLGMFTLKHISLIRTDPYKLFCSKSTELVLSCIEDVISGNMYVADIEELMERKYKPIKEGLYPMRGSEPPSPEGLKVSVLG